MRSTGEPDWFEHRHCVSLTGREPLLGRLKARLRVRGPGWGWITIRGPAGAGVSRMLDEAERLLCVDGAPRPLRVRPVTATRLPLEPLRRTLAPLFKGDTDLGLQRAIAAVLQADSSQLRALSAWLLGIEGARHRAPIDPALAGRLLLCLAAPGPLLVDDLQHLDKATHAALRPLSYGDGPGILAGCQGKFEVEALGEIWDLDPLSVAQVELLLKRWLRHAATARRLAPRLSESCAGWPGRVVQAVRQLACAGELVKEKRGIVLARTPDGWPDGQRRAEAFFEQVRVQGAQAERVVEIAATLGGLDDVEVLAEAAGVKAAFVQALTAEAVAARGGLEPDCFFPSLMVRRAYRSRLSTERIVSAQERLEKPLQRRSEEEGGSRAHKLLLVRLCADARSPDLLRAALSKALPACRPLWRLAPWELDVLVEGAKALASEADGCMEPVCEIAHELWDVGRHSQSRDLLAAAAKGDPLASLLVRARGRSPSEAHALLEAHLVKHDTPQGATGFHVLALLANCRLDAGDAAGARDAWRAAGPCLPADHSEARAQWHRGLAASYQAAGRPRLAGAHTQRALRLLLATGNLYAAAELYHAAGEIEILRGRPERALPHLLEAARLFCQLGSAENEARSHFRAGRVHTWLEAFDRAAEHLQSALDAARRSRSERLLARIHLALAHAHRGRGDLLRERRHAEWAAEAAGTTLGRVQAAAVLARSDLHVGVPGAERALLRCERDLRAAGFVREADESRAARLQGHMQAGQAEEASDLLEAGPVSAVERLASARLALAGGRTAEACDVLEKLGGDVTLPAGLRAGAYAHLADGLHMQGQSVEALARAVAAAALLEVRRRCRADDASLHLVLARVFRDVGEHGRAVGHRAAARALRRRNPRPGRRAG